MADRSEFRGAVTGLALVAAPLLVAAGVNLGIPGQALLQTLRFHIAALLVPAVLARCAAGGRRHAVVPALLAAGGLAEGATFSYRQQAERMALAAAASGSLFRVLSFNILNHIEAIGEAIADFIKPSCVD